MISGVRSLLLVSLPGLNQFLQFLLLLLVTSTSITSVRANEAFQPELTADFPHLLGLDRIKAWMDPSLDPCKDFYLYSCNGFKKRYKAFQNDTDIINLMSKSSSLLMSMILNQTGNDAMATTPVERDIFFKTRDYYASCKRQDIIDQKDFEPIKPIANQILRKFEKGHHRKQGSGEDSSSSTEDGEDGEEGREEGEMPLLQIIGELQAEAGVKLLFQSKYTSVPAHDIRDLSLQIVPADAYNVTLETIQAVFNVYLDNEIITDMSEEEFNDVTKWIYTYEKRHLLFSKHLNLQHRRKKKKNGGKDLYISMNELSEKTNLDWKPYLKPLKLIDVQEVHLWAESKAWMREIDHIQKIDRELLKYHALWRLAIAHFNKLSDPYYSLWKERIYKNALKMGFYSVDSAMTFLRKDCVKETGANLKYLAGHLYIKYAFNGTQKAEASTMVDNLFKTLRERFFSLHWMDEKTRSSALKKLDNLARIVGFPDWVLDPYQVAEYYQPLKLKPDTYFENAVQAQIFTEMMPSIRHSRHDDIERTSLFKDHMWLLNAVHLVNLVQIQINPGFIQRPLFSHMNPLAMNYGSLGAVIGHEMTHAFDSFGSQFDSEGVRRPWMSASSQRAFNTRAQCFVKQYSQMAVSFSNGTKAQVNGRHTLTENIADNGGMHTAFAAWSALETGDIYAKADPNDQFTPAQVFWLAFAQTNCDVESDKKLARQLVKDVHAPKPVRVNGAVSNSLEFAKAFNCHAPHHSKTCRIM